MQKKATPRPMPVKTNVPTLVRRAPGVADSAVAGPTTIRIAPQIPATTRHRKNHSNEPGCEQRIKLKAMLIKQSPINKRFVKRSDSQ